MIHRLEHNLTVGDLTLRQFSSQIRTDLTSRFDVDSIRARLKKSGQGGAAAAEEQRLLWEEFKTAGFARTIACVYVICMIHALIKVQVSIVSRYVLFDQQAQAARAEADAAAQLQGAGGQPGATPANTPNSQAFPGQSVPTFLPTPVCEDVNRIYFSLSKHACGLGAAELSDATAAIVRLELADQPVTALVSTERVTAALTKIRARIDRDALMMEGKEDEGSRLDPHTAASSTVAASAPSSSSSSGASPSTMVFVSSAPFSRFILPPSSALSSLVGSTSYPDPAINQMASFRLAEMIAETNAIIGSEAFAQMVRESTIAAMEEVNKILIQMAFQQNNNAQAPQATIPFANVRTTQTDGTKCACE